MNRVAGELRGRETYAENDFFYYARDRLDRSSVRLLFRRFKKKKNPGARIYIK